MDTGEIILYQPDSTLKIEVQINHNTVWLTQPQIAHLYGVDRTVIVHHIRNIYKTAELQESATCAKIAQVQIEGGRNVTREIAYFNLDVIISVGYRVNSINTTKFRQWTNTVLKEYLLRGYSINQRLLNIERKVEEHDSKIDFFVCTSLPPVGGIFFDGQVFDAYRFLCIDDTVYRLGASLKDLGKRWFAFSRMEMPATLLLNKTM